MGCLLVLLFCACVSFTIKSCGWGCNVSWTDVDGTISTSITSEELAVNMSKPSQSLHSNLQLRTFCLCPRSSGFLCCICQICPVPLILVSLDCLPESQFLGYRDGWRAWYCDGNRPPHCATREQAQTSPLTKGLHFKQISDVDFLVNCLG